MELKELIEQQGTAFAAFKKSHDEQIAELKKLGSNDPVILDRIGKIEKSLDAAVEAKAAFDRGLAAERKEREALEARINREGIKGDGDSAKRELELKDANRTLGAFNAAKNRPFTPIDQAGLDAYKSAQNKYIVGGKDALTSEEVKAMSVGGDPQGGYFVTPDTSGRIVTKVYETSPIRQIAAATTISTDSLEGIEDTDEAGAGWVGETASRADTDTPDVGKWKIDVHESYASPKATQKLLDDAGVDVSAWLAGKVSSRIARLENAAFVAGDGILKPKGFTAYTTAADDGSGVTWGTLGHIVTGLSSDFPTSNPADKLYDVMGLLKDAYLPGAVWATRRSVVTKIRKFKDGTGNYLWQPSLVAGQPETIMGYPVARMEDMPALGNGSLSLAFGNFAEGYQIVDRIGIRVLVDPYTSKPYVIFYTTKRVGGGVVNFEAIKFLKFGA